MNNVTALFKLTDDDVLTIMEMAYEKMITLRNRKGDLDSREVKLFEDCTNLIISLCEQGQKRGMTLSDINSRAMDTIHGLP